MPKIMYRPNPTPPPFVPPVPPSPDYPFPVAGSATITPSAWQQGDTVQCNVSTDHTLIAEEWQLYGFKDGQWQLTNFLWDGKSGFEFYFEDAPFDSSEFEKYCVVGTNVTPSVPSINLCFPVNG